MKLWYVDGYYDEFLAKMKRKEAIELGEEIDEEWPYPVYLAADVERMKARAQEILEALPRLPQETVERVAKELRTLYYRGYQKSRFTKAQIEKSMMDAARICRIFEEAGREITK